MGRGLQWPTCVITSRTRAGVKLHQRAIENVWGFCTSPDQHCWSLWSIVHGLICYPKIVEYRILEPCSQSNITWRTGGETEASLCKSWSSECLESLPLIIQGETCVLSMHLLRDSFKQSMLSLILTPIRANSLVAIIIWILEHCDVWSYSSNKNLAHFNTCKKGSNSLCPGHCLMAVLSK